MFKQYRRKQIAELRPYTLGEDLSGVSVSAVDCEAGSPKHGDMIARNPKNHTDQWLVSAQYFADNFEPIDVDCHHSRQRFRTDPTAVTDESINCSSEPTMEAEHR